MKRILAGTTGLLLVTCTALAFAADSGSATKKDQWDFHAGAGFAKLTNSGAPGGSIGGQVGANYVVNEMFEVGPMLGFYALGSSSAGGVDVKSSVIPITGNVVLNLGSGSSIHPYITGGVGAYMMRASASGTVGGVDYSASSTSTQLGGNAGAGFEATGSGSMGYGAEARFHIVKGEKDSEGNTGESGKVITIMATAHFH
jgi:hypothetical protein